MADHVREAERAYGRKFGARIPARAEWPGQRTQLSAALAGGGGNGPWPPRYAIRRLALHVLDHAWEVEDRHG